MREQGNQGQGPRAVHGAVQGQAPPDEEAGNGPLIFEPLDNLGNIGHNDPDREDAGEEDDEDEDDDDVNDEEEEEPIPAIMGPDDPQRMRLTRAEAQWALDIKYVIENLPEVDNLSDFWYAQLAIICKDNVEDAVRRAIGLQSFRQEYSILESLTDGSRHISDFTRLAPQFLLAVSYSQLVGSYVAVLDFKQANFDEFSSIQNNQIFFAGMYYLFHSLAPDFASIRIGTMALAECQGVEWTKKKDFKLLYEISFQLAAVYPYKAVTRNYNAGLVMNMLLSLLKRVLPEDQLQTGFSSNCRLDTLYLVPTVEAATEKNASQNKA
jgi:hypothetical protein